MTSVKLCRPKSLVIYWKDTDIVIENYLSGSVLAADELTIRLLGAFHEWIEPTEVVNQFPEYDPQSVLDSIEQLVTASFLMTYEDTNRALDESLEQAWPYWGHETRFFHFSSRNAQYLTHQASQEHIQQQVLDGPPPSILKRYPSALRTYLPRAFLDLSLPFRDVILERRTIRKFLHTPIGLRAFSTLLFYAFSPMYFIDAQELGILTMKTSASAGARHETEFYLGIHHVEGIERGLYHYCVEDHSLELLTSHWTPEQAVSYCGEQEWIAQTGFVCFVTARFERLTWKYRHPRCISRCFYGFRSCWTNICSSCHSARTLPIYNQRN